jgi:hypothetical protein
MLSNKIDNEEVAKVPIKFKEVEGGKRLVYDFNEMLSFLDQGWEVEEEYSGDSFLMMKKMENTR